MGRVIREIDRGTRIIDNTIITVTQLVWDDGGASFDAALPDGTLLTEDGSFDSLPTAEQLLNRYDEHRGLWRCPGCTTAVLAGDQELVTDHLRDCTDQGGVR